MYSADTGRARQPFTFVPLARCKSLILSFRVSKIPSRWFKKVDASLQSMVSTVKASSGYLQSNLRLQASALVLEIEGLLLGRKNEVQGKQHIEALKGIEAKALGLWPCA